MEEKYIFLILGVILGAAIMLYFFCNREEKIERTIIRNQKVFSTKKLDLTMQNVVERIDYNIKNNKEKTSYYFYFIMAKIIFSVFHNA